MVPGKMNDTEVITRTAYFEVIDRIGNLSGTKPSMQAVRRSSLIHILCDGNRLFLVGC